MYDGQDLPLWISLTQETMTNFQISPTSGQLVNDNPYIVRVTFDADFGLINPSYNALSIVVTCSVTHFSLSNPNPTYEYTILSGLQTIDLSGVVFEQQPNCEYHMSTVY